MPPDLDGVVVHEVCKGDEFSVPGHVANAAPTAGPGDDEGIPEQVQPALGEYLAVQCLGGSGCEMGTPELIQSTRIVCGVPRRSW